jgi:predicted DNA-binding transcriptional regulator AlpA
MEIEPLLLTIPDICKMLNIAHSTFYSLCSSGKFAPLPVKLCRKVLYNKAEVENWVSSGCPHRRQWIVMRGQRI